MRTAVRPRLRALAGLLAAADHDVVCLQEVMWRANARLLTVSLPHHAYAGTALLRGGLVLLSRLPIVSARFVRFPMSGPPRPELLMRKGVQVVTVSAPAGPVTVLNTHLSAYSAANRAVEVRALAGVVASVPPAMPLVLAGDLNLARTSSLLAGLLTATGLHDARAGDTDPTFRPTDEWPDPAALDHVLLRPGMTARTALVFQDPVPLADGRTVYLSDHYGIEAEIS